MAAPPARVAYLIDVDDTLLDGDAFVADWHAQLLSLIGAERQARYWAHFDALRSELGYADYLGALQRFRLECPHEPRLCDAAAFLVEYPFRDLLLPQALTTIGHLARSGPVIILSDGDMIYQPLKIRRAGLADAAEGRVLIYVHKERELAEVARLHPAEHYVIIDDKITILAAVKQAWGARVTTVFPRQGHYANDPALRSWHRFADLAIEHIAELMGHDASTLIEAGRARPAP